MSRGLTADMGTDELPEIVLYHSVQDYPGPQWDWYASEDYAGSAFTAPLGGWHIGSWPDPATGRKRWSGYASWTEYYGTAVPRGSDVGSYSADHESAEEVMRSLSGMTGYRIRIDPSRVWRMFAVDGTPWNGKPDEENPPGKRAPRKIADWYKLVPAEARAQRVRVRHHQRLRFEAPW